MRPYYESQGIALYHGDCLALLPAFQSASADLIITDPPYGVAWQSGRRAEKFAPIAGDATKGMAADLVFPSLRESLRVLKRGRHVYVFGRWDFSGLPLSDSVELVWDKVLLGSGNLELPWSPQHEYIQFAVASGSRKSSGSRLAARLRRGSVLRYPRPHGAAVARHPTEKPVGLLRELIESSSLIGEVVLDPFAGSGSTLMAAAVEGRKAIGIELDEQYCEVAAQRLRRLVGG